MAHSQMWKYGIILQRVKKKDVEAMDRLFFRRLLEVPESTPCESYYLEFGVLPISIIVKARRINYLHSILKRGKQVMLYNFFITQWNNPCKGDWTETVRQDLADFDIDSSFSSFVSKSKEAFNKKVKVKATEYALRCLQEKKATHSKLDNLAYSKLEIQQYLTSDQKSVSEKRVLFRCRVRMERFGENFRGGKGPVMSPLCNQHLDNQALVFQCPEIRKEIEIKGCIEDIYKDEMKPETIKTMTKILELRKSRMDQ